MDRVYRKKRIFVLVALFAWSLMSACRSPVLAEDETSNPYEEVRLSRLSLIEGEVLLQRGDDEEWNPASVNMPLRPYDKLWATDGARTEIQFDDGSLVRLAENTNLDLLDLDQGRTHLQLTLGVASFVARFPSRIANEEVFFEVDTPQAALLVDRSAKFRIDVAEDGSTEITVREGEIKLTSDEEPIVVAKNQRVVIESGESPRYLLESAAPSDEWDQWNEIRDDQIAQARSRQYLPPDISMGVTELDAYGSWAQVPVYGSVWYPQVPVGWAPYQAGRWVWVEPWGWTWVSYEPWGWVPYHHGRWVIVSGRWVWVPGPRREIWAPGCVRFIYGPEWVAWVPLAPGEVYYYNPRVSAPIDVHLINYRVPGAVVILPRRTFVTGEPVTGRFVPPGDPIRAGRVVAGPPPIMPAQESLRPLPRREIRTNLLPPPLAHRPVVYYHPASNPPARFEDRVKELHEVVPQGRPPIVIRPRVEERRLPRFEERPGREKIHKDIIVRKLIRESVREGGIVREPRQPAGPVRPQPRLPKHFELQKKAPGPPSEVRPLYRKPPQPPTSREIR